jgi:hypothetical protein
VDSTPATVSITVTFVNQPPSFTVGSNQTVNENAGGQTVTAWATNISPGPNQSGLTVHFNITADSNAALFSVAPAVSSTGTLTYTPAGGATGIATIMLDLQNSGGTANGGMDTSATQGFTITVQAAPQITSASSTTFQPGKTGQSFAVTTTGFPTGASMVITETGALPGGVTLTNNNNGTATINGIPASGAAGSTGTPHSMGYVLTIGASNGVTPAASQSFTLNITCPVITVSGTTPLNLTYGASITTSTYTQSGGNGSITWSITGQPTGLTIGGANGQVIGTPSVTGTFSATVTAIDSGGCTGSKLVSIVVAPNLTSLSYTGVGNTQFFTTGATGAPTTPAISSASGLLSGVTPASSMITAASCTSGGTLSAVDAAGHFIFTPNVSASSATCTYTASSNTGSGSTGATSSTGSLGFSLNNRVWYVNNATSSGINDGRSNTPFKTMTSVGSVSTSGDYIYVSQGSGSTTGTYTLLTNQTLVGAGATFTLGALSITGSQSTAPTLSSTLSASGVGGVTVSGISMSTGASQAISFSNVANGSFTFLSISTNGGTNGISLTNTTGSFAVTGGGASNPTNTTKGRTTAGLGGTTLTLGSGGTIQNATGAGILLSNATNVTLQNMLIQNNGGSGVNNGGDGINASGSSSLSLDNVLISGHTGNAGLYASSLAGLSIQHTQISSNATNSGVGSNLWNVTFGQPPCSSSCTNGLTGTATVANSIFDTSFQNTFGVVSHNSATLSLTATNSQFSNGGNDGLQIIAWDTSNVSLTVTGSDAHQNVGGGVEYIGQGSSGGGTITVTGSSFEQNGSSGGADINVFHEGLGKTVTFDIESNTTRQTFVSGSSASISAVIGNLANTATLLQGKILNNTIGNAAVADSGSSQSSGIAVQTDAPGTITALITGNTVKQTDDDGLLVLATSQTTSTINVTASGNDFEVSPTDPNTNLGLELTAGGSGGSDLICANISGNIKEIGNSGVAGIATEVLGTSTIQLQGYAGAANINAQIASFLNGTATTVAPAGLNFGGGGTVKAATSTCPTPP